MKNQTRFFSGLIITLVTLQALAANTITITVNTTEKSAAAVGYSVEGKELGGTGKSYTGKGPMNKKYVFGYRKSSVKGFDVSCGALTLTKNSHVSLITKGGKCRSVIK